VLLRFRHEIALAATILIFSALFEMPQISVERPHEIPPPTMQLTLEAPPPPPPAPPQPVTPPTPVPPPPPQPVTAESAEHPLAPPPKPVVVKKLPPKIKHVKAIQPPKPATPPAPPSQAAPQAAPAPPTPAPPGPVQSAGPLNASYDALVTAEVKSLHHYPTGREALTQHPQGTAIVSFTLNRDGSLADASIATASGSILLDKAALETVQRAHYPAFPDGAYPGESSHSFTVDLVYNPPSE
jgi:protein TonB